MSQHSVLAPSSAHRRLRCVGSLAASKGIPNLSSVYSAEGTAYHELAAQALEGAGAFRDCADFAGLNAYVLTDGSCVIGDIPKPGHAEFTFTIDEDNAAHAQVYVDAIRRIPGVHYIETRVDTSYVVGVPDQGGTVDAITLDFEHDTLHVDDLKFGRGEVVDAFDNEQLLEYGAAALLKYEMLHDWKFLKIAIHQPRVNHYSEMTYAVDKVWEWVEHIRPLEKAAYKLWENTPSDLVPFLTASEKGCRWCPIRNTCSVRTKQVLDQFPVQEPELGGMKLTAVHLTLEALAEARDRVDAIEQWCADIKQEAHMRAMRGDKLPGWKLVEGRKGNRKWGDEELARSLMVDKISEAAYKPRETISPADAEKKLKKEHASTWAELQKVITQAPPGLSLERDSVSKPAVSRPMNEFPVMEPTA